MACFKLPAPPPLPSLGPLSIPGLSLDGLPDLGFCCGNIRLSQVFNGVNVPGIPISAVLFAPINEVILVLDAWIAAYDLINVECPFD